MLRLMRKALCRDPKAKNNKNKKRGRQGMSITNIVYESYLEDSQDGRQSVTSDDNDLMRTRITENAEPQIYDEISEKDNANATTDVTESKKEVDASETDDEASSGDENGGMYNHLTTFNKRMKFNHYDTLRRENLVSNNIWRTQSAMEIRHKNIKTPTLKVTDVCADVTNNNDITKRYLKNANVTYKRSSTVHLSNSTDKALCTYRRTRKQNSTENKVSQMIANLETKSKQSTSVQSLNNIPRRYVRDSAKQRRNVPTAKVNSFKHEKPITRSATLYQHSQSQDGGKKPNNELFNSFLFNTMRTRMSSRY